jgi:flavin-dependent dehydrogenase
MDIGRQVLACKHMRIEGVCFLSSEGLSVRIPLPESQTPEIAITRGRLDAVLLDHARHSGVEIHQNAPLTSLTRTNTAWTIASHDALYEAKELVAADGRNSTVARLLGMMPTPVRDQRVGIQTHAASPETQGNDISLQFVREGYAGIAPVGDGFANFCLVGQTDQLQALKEWAIATYKIPSGHIWRSISPLSRRPLPVIQKNLWFVGDTARVVEPFTGEGISYALRTGALCADALLAGDPQLYARTHRELYRGRLWPNTLARWACTNPSLGSFLVGAGRYFPSLFRLLTRKVIS